MKKVKLTSLGESDKSGRGNGSKSFPERLKRLNPLKEGKVKEPWSPFWFKLNDMTCFVLGFAGPHSTPYQVQGSPSNQFVDFVHSSPFVSL